MMTFPLAQTLAEITVSTNNGWYAGWGTLALVNAGLAQSKNRSGLNWFLLSIFLGPLATLFIVLSDPLEE